MPLKESHLVQIGCGEHEVALQMATVGDIGLLRNGFALESIGINVLLPNYIAFLIPETWTGDYLVNGEIATQSSFFMSGDLDSFHLQSKSRITMGVTLPRQLFVEAIAALTGVYQEDIKLSNRHFHLNKTDIFTFKSKLKGIMGETCNNPHKYCHTEITNEVIGLLTDAYLRALPHFPRQTETANNLVRIVRRAEERFREASCKPISLVDICTEVGVGKSTLYKAFDHVTGLPPLAYFQKRRLMQAHSMLLNAEPTRGGVKQAALSCGFTELGRFSVQYRNLFGEQPMCTLNRNRNWNM